MQPRLRSRERKAKLLNQQKQILRHRTRELYDAHTTTGKAEMLNNVEYF